MSLSERVRKLVGERVELRRHARENYGLYARWYGDPETWHLTSWAKAPLSRSETERMFKERERSTTDDSFAIHRKGEREPLGVISLTNINKGQGSAELSVIVGFEEDRDLGYGTEAIEVLLRYAFEDLGLDRVGLSVFEFNEAAISAYKKLGFEEEGRMRRTIERDGEFYDAILMRVLKTEWRE